LEFSIRGPTFAGKIMNSRTLATVAICPVQFLSWSSYGWWFIAPKKCEWHALPLFYDIQVTVNVLWRKCVRMATTWVPRACPNWGSACSKKL